LKGVFIAGSSLSSILGKTQYLAWGCTTENKDTQDLYRERV
jgi:acyl-homoserine lactone acylase PvdQ